MNGTFALRLALAALAGLALAGCNNSSAPMSSTQAQPQASEQSAPIEFPLPKDVEERDKQRESAARASSTQTVFSELGDMYKRAQKASPAPATSAP